MNRRELLYGAGIAAASTMTAAALPQNSHDHHHAAGADALVKTSSECVNAAEICVAHCEESLASGDKTLAYCLKTSSQVATVCDALRSLAARNAELVPQMAAVAYKACQDCEAECRKHEKTHTICKACGDACAACAMECKKVQRT